ncbi:hypothetical protein HS041_22425 [Planomonospora sp. ID67723]|uniref:hypothetical protein n=1 Tax=Planomonospora sp. ID67723 TaxID=2738134 RepID=UPI0018C40905|nr:hypothetical protein [Planomonospora sp. ID67723]MBG0830521.1 hypothetical protein [Planomonospora sp. ID67723]
MSENTPEPTTQGTPPTEQPAAPTAAPPAQETGTDWVAEARKWEKRAKENSKAAEELEKLKTEAMSEQEKAVAAARKEGETSAIVKAGQRVARAEFKAAVAAKGLDLGEALDLIDTTKFVDDKGDVDEAEIKKAVGKLAKVAAPKAPSSSGGDFGGGNGGGQTPKGLREQIAEAEAKGDWKTARTLKTQLMLTTQ